MKNKVFGLQILDFSHHDFSNDTDETRNGQIEQVVEVALID